MCNVYVRIYAVHNAHACMRMKHKYSYIYFQVYNAAKLLEFCQGFLLQNIVTLLNYDESVKRLLFAKKVPNHDVLHGLLLALQARIEYRYAAPNALQSRRSADSAKTG